MSNSQSEWESELLESMLGDFLDESDQHLTQLNSNLLQLDEWVQTLGEGHRGSCDQQLLNEMFRSAHSLKGLSGMLGLTDINQLTHKIENIFDAARRGHLTITSDVTELVFTGLDHLTALVGLLKEPGGDPVDCSRVVESIRQMLERTDPRKNPPAASPAKEEAPDRVSVREHQETGSVEPPVPDPLEDIADEAEIPDHYLSLFVDETDSSLDVLTSGLLALEDAANGGQATVGCELKNLLATAHKIKGSAASVGLHRAAKLMHLVEDLLEQAVAGSQPLSPRTADLLLNCTDGLRRYVTGLRQGRHPSDNLGPLAQDLLAAKTLRSSPEDLEYSNPSPSRRSSSTDAVDSHRFVPTAGLRERLDDVLNEIRQRLESAELKQVAEATKVAVSTLRRVRKGSDAQLKIFWQLADYLDGGVTSAPTPSARTQQTYVGQVIFQPDLPTAALKAQLIYEKLVKLGTVNQCQPSSEQLDAVDQLDSFRFHIATDQTAETVARHVRVAGVLQASVQLLSDAPSEPSRPSAGRQTQPASEQPASEQTIASCQKVADDPSPRHQDAARPLLATASAATSETPRPPSDTNQRATTNGQRPAETVRVDTDRLDQLMDLAGQLVINKAQFSQIGGRLKSITDCNQAARVLDRLSGELDKLGNGGTHRIDAQHSTAELDSVRGHIRRIRGDLENIRHEVQTLNRARDSVRGLFEAIHQLDRVSDGIQKSVMDIRMVPIGPLFARFHRVVRDISRAGGKLIRLEIAGEKTELDKRMIDELGDPLVHLVRNAADHGIELPADREAAGKPRQGAVKLDAFHRGNSIVIEVRDDGRGLDAERILRKAIDKGLVTEADAPRLTTHQIYQLIWQPGLSTAEKVTDVSGRGMGMDIVKTKIEQLSGSVEISSELGQGTTIKVKLPLTLAILPSLMVDIAGGVFALPMETVTEIVSVGRDQIRTVQGRPTAIVRGRVISLVRLGDLLSFHRQGIDPRRPPPDTTLVIINDAGQELGLAVDLVIGEEDVVIKSIAENYQNVMGIAGASILGDGRVALILDVPTLITTLARHTATVGM